MHGQSFTSLQLLPRRGVLGLVLAAGLAGCGGNDHHFPALTAYPAPVQVALQTPLPPIQVTAQVTAQPVARYTIVAHVMAVERYRWGELAEAVPADYALAWGPAAVAEVMTKISVRQSGRWYYWRVKDRDEMPPISMSALNSNMANVHVLPADEQVAQALKQAKPGTSLRASGYLVNLKSASEGSMLSSLIRGDSGAGSCEIFYVEQVEVVAAL